MSGRIDKLFSPQRLRQNWKKSADFERGRAEVAGRAGGAGIAGGAGSAGAGAPGTAGAPGRGGAAGTAGTPGSAGLPGRAGEAAEPMPVRHHQGAEAFAVAVRPEFELLRSLIHQQFPENQSKVLDMMLEELHTLLKEAGGDMTALRQTIEEALNQIEDLIEAWDA